LIREANFITTGYTNYVAAYEDAIFEFVFEMNEKQAIGNAFFRNFYHTCHDMIDNGACLSDRQLKIIEEEMHRLNRPIPQASQFEFRLSLPLKFRLKEKPFHKRVDLGDFYCALNISPELSKGYENAFEKNLHFIFHLPI